MTHYVKAAFINETMHPMALSLFDAIKLSRDQYEGDGQFYAPLSLWQHTTDYSDEQMAELYARVEEGFGLGGWDGLTQGQQVSKLSLFLWQTAH